MDSPAFVERSGPGGPHEISDLGKAGVRATSSEAVAVSGTFPAATRLTPNGPETPRGLQGAPLQRAVSAEVSESYFSPGDAESPTTSPVRDAERYERLRGEAARQGMKMLEEERERNREMNQLLKARVEDLEIELDKTRTRLGKKCAEYEEVLQMANEIALAYEQRSSRFSNDMREQAVQTDSRMGRDNRQAAAAAPATRGQHLTSSPEAPATPRTPYTAHGTMSARLAMHFPCSRPRKAYPEEADDDQRASDPYLEDEKTYSPHLCASPSPLRHASSTQSPLSHPDTESDQSDRLRRHGRRAPGSLGGDSSDDTKGGGEDDVKSKMLATLEMAQATILTFLSPRAAP